MVLSKNKDLSGSRKHPVQMESTSNTSSAPWLKPADNQTSWMGTEVGQGSGRSGDREVRGQGGQVLDIDSYTTNTFYKHLYLY